MARLDGKTAVVTGGANGIGRACCIRFAEEGADVVVADLEGTSGAETVEAVKALGRSAVFVPADASSSDDVDAVMEAALTMGGGIDILLTAAGISHAGYESEDREGEMRRIQESAVLLQDPATRFVDLPVDEWQRVLDVNLTGTLRAIQAAVRRMLAQSKGGSIITIASVAAKHPDAGPLAYAVSKAGVWMLTKHAARSLGTAGIRVNAIGPGYIDTNMTALLKEYPDLRDQLLAKLPLGRVGLPREVADAALFLASDESSYFTGEILHPDGGFYTD